MRAAILCELGDMGISVAVDDFGTGYSNLSYLIDFRFKKLKIDRSFVARMETDNSSGAVVSTIVGLSRALGVRTIAEGVETEGQATLLRAAGCDVVQGFLFGRPQPLDLATIRSIKDDQTAQAERPIELASMPRASTLKLRTYQTRGDQNLEPLVARTFLESRKPRRQEALVREAPHWPPCTGGRPCAGPWPPPRSWRGPRAGSAPCPTAWKGGFITMRLYCRSSGSAVTSRQNTSTRTPSGTDARLARAALAGGKVGLRRDAGQGRRLCVTAVRRKR